MRMRKFAKKHPRLAQQLKEGGEYLCNLYSNARRINLSLGQQVLGGRFRIERALDTKGRLNEGR